MEPLRVGIIGLGNISGIYFENLKRYSATEIVAVADLDAARATATAEKHGIGKALTPEQLVTDADVELVLNLTIPGAHYSVQKLAVENGKHVYTEKPLTVERDEAAEILEIAGRNGVRVGGAPDTFLGGAHQACRAAIQEGLIGDVIGSHSFMLCHGHESWHPAPEFYYKKGGGPMFDMGPYYLTALVNMIGPIRTVSGSARVTFPTRTITSQPLNGTVINVDVPTHVAGIMEFANGAIGEITTSFDVWHSQVPPILIYGSEGSLAVPDPNGFGGEPKIRLRGDSEWQPLPVEFGFTGNSRGVGVLDMAVAIRENRPHRASGALAFHVLDAMHAFHESSDQRRHVDLSVGLEKPEIMARDQYSDLI